MQSNTSIRKLSVYENCPAHLHLLDNHANLPIYPDYMAMMYIIERYIPLIGSKEARQEVEQLCTKIGKPHLKLPTKYLCNLLVYMKKKFHDLSPITETYYLSQETSYNIAFSPNLIYGRKNVTCFTVIIPETIEENCQMSIGDILNYLPIQAACIMNNSQEKIVEAIILNTEGECSTYHIYLTDTQTYLLYCIECIQKAYRRYILDQKHSTNWSIKCNWCPQKTMCAYSANIVSKWSTIISQVR